MAIDPSRMAWSPAFATTVGRMAKRVSGAHDSTFSDENRGSRLLAFALRRRNSCSKAAISGMLGASSSSPRFKRSLSLVSKLRIRLSATPRALIPLPESTENSDCEGAFAVLSGRSSAFAARTSGRLASNTAHHARHWSRTTGGTRSCFFVAA